MTGSRTKTLIRLFRGLERLALVVFLLLLLVMLGPALIGPHYLAHRFSPSQAIATPEALETRLGVPLQRIQIQLQGEAYILAIAPMVMWAMPEGPPVYVFDVQDGLIDYTTDLGDDQDFVARWITASDFASSGWSIRDALP
ncbi:MAG: hypothetical protein P8103_19100 [Candidatus Thiodiazotropha sp.]